MSDPSSDWHILVSCRSQVRAQVQQHQAALFLINCRIWFQSMESKVLEKFQSYRDKCVKHPHLSREFSPEQLMKLRTPTVTLGLGHVSLHLCSLYCFANSDLWATSQQRPSVPLFSSFSPSGVEQVLRSYTSFLFLEQFFVQDLTLPVTQTEHDISFCVCLKYFPKGDVTRGTVTQGWIDIARVFLDHKLVAAARKHL